MTSGCLSTLAAPMTPFARVPMLALVGAIKDGVTVKDGQPVATKKLKITITMDHRYIDGAQTKAMLVALRSVFEDPHSVLEASE
jgi:pyruvate/2-oxoglutarate dehydrogenase complex dihydrolipoamide acyltransferase (E2) component